jgi:hypothetical protein
MLLTGDVNDAFQSAMLLTRQVTRGGSEKMCGNHFEPPTSFLSHLRKWCKMMQRLDHRDGFRSVQNVLDYFSNRVSELFLTYRNELIDEGRCRRVKGPGCFTFEGSTHRYRRCEARALSSIITQPLCETASVTLESLSFHDVEGRISVQMGKAKMACEKMPRVFRQDELRRSHPS